AESCDVRKRPFVMALPSWEPAELRRLPPRSGELQLSVRLRGALQKKWAAVIHGSPDHWFEQLFINIDVAAALPAVASAAGQAHGEQRTTAGLRKSRRADDWIPFDFWR